MLRACRGRRFAASPAFRGAVVKITTAQIGDVLIHAQTGERVRVVNVFTTTLPDGSNVRAADFRQGDGGELFRVYASGDPDVWSRDGGQS